METRTITSQKVKKIEGIKVSSLELVDGFVFVLFIDSTGAEFNTKSIQCDDPLLR